MRTLTHRLNPHYCVSFRSVESHSPIFPPIMEMKNSDPSGSTSSLQNQQQQQQVTLAHHQSQGSTMSFPNQALPRRGSYHRRAHSEVHFRLPDNLDLDLDPFDVPSATFEDLGSELDMFSTYMDIEKLGSRPEDRPSGSHLKQTDTGTNVASTTAANAVSGGVDNVELENSEVEKNRKSRHVHNHSLDGCSSLESIEAKKAMDPDKLAELWTVDPKRAKRILANRQSAARSKERKARYILELERKVQNLQTEATTLSAQLHLFQRDTSGLTTENTELKFRLQAMEQQAQLRDALNEALTKEVERLKVATGETVTPTDAYSLAMHPFSQPSFSHQSLHGLGEAPNIQRQEQQFHPYVSHMSTPHQPLHTNPHDLSEMLQHDPIGQFQGLEISSRGSHIVRT